jgi:hypothetical protein
MGQPGEPSLEPVGDSGSGHAKSGIQEEDGASDNGPASTDAEFRELCLQDFWSPDDLTHLPDGDDDVDPQLPMGEL